MSEEEKKDSDIQLEQSEQLQSQEGIMEEQPKQQVEPEQETVQSEQQPFPLEEQPKKQWSKDKKMFLIGGAAVLLLIIVLFLKENAVGTNSKEKADYPIAYLKEDVLYTYDLKKEPHEIDTIEDDRSYEIYKDDEKAIVFSENKQKIFYKNNITREGSFDLCYENLKTGDKKIIAEDVYSFQISPDGNGCIYVTESMYGDGKLYFYDFKKETLLSKDALSNLDEFGYLNIKQNCVIYPKWSYGNKKDTGTKTALYKVSLNGKEEEEICEDIYQLISDPKSDFVYFIETGENYESLGSLYHYNLKDEPVLVSEDVMNAYLLENKKDIVYITAEKKSVPDIQLVKNDVGSRKNSLLNELKKSTISLWAYDGFLYSNGQSEKIAQNIYDAYNLDEKNQSFLVIRPNVEKVKLSEFYSVEGFEYMYRKKEENASYDMILVTPDKEEVEILSNISLERFTLSQSKDKLLVLEKKGYSNYLQLMEFSKDRKKIIDKKELNDDADYARFSQTQKGEFMYLENADDSLYYVEGKEPVLVAEDISFMDFAKDSKKLYFVQREDSEGDSYVLQYFENGKTEKIDDDVDYILNRKNSLLYAKNYDYLEETRDLYLFDGKQTIEIDTEVTSDIFY